jgi:hypothetical protein
MIGTYSERGVLPRAAPFFQQRLDADVSALVELELRARYGARAPAAWRRCGPAPVAACGRLFTLCGLWRLSVYLVRALEALCLPCAGSGGSLFTLCGLWRLSVFLVLALEALCLPCAGSGGSLFALCWLWRLSVYLVRGQGGSYGAC